MNSMNNISAPLTRIKVLDFSELLPGPFFTQNLVDLGAHVTKIERAPDGDGARRIAPGLFASVNRGKHSIKANLKDTQEAASVKKLVSEVDIVVEGFRPGVMKRLGFDYETLSAINPRIIYVSLSGYGQTGRHAMMPGHDINYLASAGILAISGSDPSQPSAGAGVPLADLCGSMYALSSTLAALIQRDRTGCGQFLDVSLTDCAMHWMNPRFGHFDHAQIRPLMSQRKDLLSKPAYGVFRTQDGEFLSIAALEDHFWERLSQALDLDPAIATLKLYDQRVPEAGRINQIVAQRIALEPLHALFERLVRADVPVSVVKTPDQVRSSDHCIERGLTSADAAEFIRYPVAMAGMQRTES